MNYDNILIKIFIPKNIRIDGNQIRKLFNNKYPNIQNYLLNRFSDSDNIYNEILWRIFYKQEKRNYCKLCGNKTKFDLKEFKNTNLLYKNYCCASCAAKSKERNNKLKDTCLEKYGVTHMFKSKEVKEKSKQTCLEKYNNSNYNNREKAKETCLEKYNNSNYNNREKAKETCLKKYGVKSPIQNINIYNKIKQTCLEKYGVKYPWQIEEIKNKIKETNLKKYGVDNILKLKSNIIYSHSKEILNKIKITKDKNHTHNTSQGEENYYKYLISLYGEKDIKRNYKSKEYPFNCDFYIISEDKYIEYQGSWTHGGHPFNSTLKEDIEKLNLWKSKNTKYYNNAINTWTIRDIKKRETAKKNNLNFEEIWP